MEVVDEVTEERERVNEARRAAMSDGRVLWLASTGEREIHPCR